jgi:hypothetical protein
VGIRIREKYKQVPHELIHEEKDDIKKYGYSFAHKYDHVYTGKLIFQIIDPFFIKNKEISDGKRKKLEDKIGVILLKILREAKDQLEWNILRKKREKEEYQHRLQELELLEKQRQEQEKIDALEKQVESWRKSCHIREYLKAAVDCVTQKHGGYDDESELGLWLKWAHSYADRMDPLKMNEQ